MGGGYGGNFKGHYLEVVLYSSFRKKNENNVHRRKYLLITILKLLNQTKKQSLLFINYPICIKVIKQMRSTLFTFSPSWKRASLH